MAHKQWLSLGLILLCAQIGLIGFAYFQYFVRSPGEFFAKPPNDPIFRLTVLERPNVSSKALLSWATLAATATFSLDFVNYEENIKALKDYFTVDGYQNFLQSLSAAGTVATILDKKLVLTAVPIGPAIILSEGEQYGGYTWQIQLPLLIRYQSVSTNETSVKLITMLVTQVSTKLASKGIGIAQYIAVDAGSDYAGYSP